MAGRTGLPVKMRFIGQQILEETDLREAQAILLARFIRNAVGAAGDGVLLMQHRLCFRAGLGGEQWAARKDSRQSPPSPPGPGA